MNALERPKATDGLDMRTVDAEVIVHDALHERVHVLNTTAAAILRLCDGRRTTADIVQAMAAATGASPSRITVDLESTLRTFSELGLLAQ